VVIEGIRRRIEFGDPPERVSFANNHGLCSQEGLILAVPLFAPPSPRFQQISAARAKERTAKSRNKFCAGKNRPSGLEALKQDVPSDVDVHCEALRLGNLRKKITKICSTRVVTHQDSFAPNRETLRR